MGKVIGRALGRLAKTLLGIGALVGQATHQNGCWVWEMMCHLPRRVNQLLKRVAGDGNAGRYRLYVGVASFFLVAAVVGVLALLWSSTDIRLLMPIIALLSGIALLFIGGGYKDRSTRSWVSTVGLVVVLVGLFSALNRMDGLLSPDVKHYEVISSPGLGFNVYVPPEFAKDFPVYQQACHDLGYDREITWVAFWNDRTKVPTGPGILTDVQVDAEVAYYIKNTHSNVNVFTWYPADEKRYVEVGPIY